MNVIRGVMCRHVTRQHDNLHCTHTHYYYYTLLSPCIHEYRRGMGSIDVRGGVQFPLFF